MAAARIRDHRRAFARQHPFRKHVVAPFALLWRYLARRGTETLFDVPFAQLGLWKKAFKIMQSLLYMATAILGVASALGLILSARWRAMDEGLRLPGLAAAVFAVFFALAYPLIMRRVEGRYLVPGLPASVLSAAVVAARLRGARSAR